MSYQILGNVTERELKEPSNALFSGTTVALLVPELSASLSKILKKLKFLHLMTSGDVIFALI